jgi:hypothetical protein
VGLLFLVLLSAAIAASLGVVHGFRDGRAHGRSIELGGVGDKALRPQAGIAWHEAAAKPSESTPQAANQGSQVAVAAILGRVDAVVPCAQRHASFLAWRTRNPRDPPGAIV